MSILERVGRAERRSTFYVVVYVGLDTDQWLYRHQDAEDGNDEVSYVAEVKLIGPFRTIGAAEGWAGPASQSGGPIERCAWSVEPVLDPDALWEQP